MTPSWNARNSITHGGRGSAPADDAARVPATTSIPAATEPPARWSSRCPAVGTPIRAGPPAMAQTRMTSRRDGTGDLSSDRTAASMMISPTFTNSDGVSWKLRDLEPALSRGRVADGRRADAGDPHEHEHHDHARVDEPRVYLHEPVVERGHQEHQDHPDDGGHHLLLHAGERALALPRAASSRWPSTPGTAPPPGSAPVTSRSMGSRWRMGRRSSLACAPRRGPSVLPRPRPTTLVDVQAEDVLVDLARDGRRRLRPEAALLHHARPPRTSGRSRARTTRTTTSTGTARASAVPVLPAMGYWETGSPGTRWPPCRSAVTVASASRMYWSCACV